MKYITSFILVLSLASLTGCFEIVEQVFVKADGSGSFVLALNLSKSKTKLNSIRQLKTVNGHSVPTEKEIREKMAGIEKAVARTAGISNVKTSMDFENYIASIACNFTKISQLNSVVKNVASLDKNNKKFIEKSYDFNSATNLFSRLNNLSLKQDYHKMSNADKEVFATANYTAVYKFDQTVLTVSNKDAKISPSKKAVMLQQKALDVITEKKSIENNITLTKP